MKTSLRLVCLMIALLAFTKAANSQQFAIPGGGVQGPAYGGGGGVYEPAAFQATGGDISTGFPGRIWFRSNFADQALGYEGSYLTLGGKTRLFNDFLDGRWLGEARAHYSYENGGFFGNFGIERVFSIAQTGADFSVSGWLDYDDDQQGDFGQTYIQTGVNATIRTRRWDFIANGYFPLETQDHEIVATVDNIFLGNSILLTPGSDSGLGGFDTLLNFRPPALARVNGTFALGAYGYGSDLISYVGGGRVRVGMQLMNNLTVNAEINYDDRFETTGVLGLGWAWGNNARGNEYSQLGRDLESTIRNDHVVRFAEQAVFAINPKTGNPYNIIHVDNSATPVAENGTAERPFNSLADAELASSVNDIIFVRNGNGNSALLNQGIVLQDHQQLLGEGSVNLLPIQNGLNFQFGVDNPALRPTLSNMNGGNVITLAKGNVVRSFNIDGADASNGIFADGSDGGTIEDVTITGTPDNGILLNNISGDFLITNTDVSNSGLDGLVVQGSSGPTNLDLVRTSFNNNNTGIRFNDFDAESVSISNTTALSNSLDGIAFNDSDIDSLAIANTAANNNGRNGLVLSDFDGDSLSIIDSSTNVNARNGLILENYVNSSGEGIDAAVTNFTSNANGMFGVDIENGAGNLAFEGIVSTNNGFDGLSLIDWTTTADQLVSISSGTGAGLANFSGNGGAGIDVELNAGSQNLSISDVNANNNGLEGLSVNTSGAATTLNLDVIDNLGFNNNAQQGILVQATSGSMIDLDISQSAGFTPGPLSVVGNMGGGIEIIAGTGGGVSEIDANLRNLNLTNNADAGRFTGQALAIDAIQDGLITLNAEDIDVINNVTGIVITVQDNPNANAIGPSVFTLSRINAADNMGTSFLVLSGDDSLTDLVLEDSVFDGNSNFIPQTGPIFTDLTQSGIIGGVNVFASGANNMTRAVLRRNSINRFDSTGIGLNSADTSVLLVDLIDNDLDSNGFGPGRLGSGVGVAILPFANGITATASGDSQLGYRAEDNLVNNSFEFGLAQTAMGNAQIVASLIGNDFTGNDIAEDPDNDMLGLFEANGIDVAFTNGATSNTILSLSNNDFDPTTAGFFNAGLPGQLEIALDGLTNGPGLIQGNIATPNQAGVFGTTGVTNFGILESTFSNAGF